MVKPLDRKLLRDLFGLKGQLITIALVVAAGIASFVSFRSAFSALEGSMEAYYARHRFAHVFARLERAPKLVEERLEAVPGVARVATRVVERVTLPIPELPEPGVGTVISLPDLGQPPLNGLHLVAGRLPETGRAGEVVLIESFAERHRIGPGDTLPAVFSGTEHRLTVVGLAMAPELIFPMDAGELMPDETRFAALWMRESALAPLAEMDGAFNDVAMMLEPGASLQAVLAAVDRVLAPYGGFGAYGREHQPSHYVLSGELSQLRSFATMAPLIFLGVAAFLVNVVLSRLVQLQRPEIAALGALGYARREIAGHFLKLVLVIVLLGAALGVALGAWLGGGLVELYAQYFRFPTLGFGLDLEVVSVAVLVSVLVAVAGALFTARTIMSLPPAEAMRPAPPASYRPLVLERLGLARFLPQTWRIVLRELERRPIRTLLSAVGLALAVGMMVVGRYPYDATEHLITSYFFDATREDLSVNFTQPIPKGALSELRALPGVTLVEGMRVVPVKMRSGHVSRETMIFGYPEDLELRRILDAAGRVSAPPEEGVLLTTKLAELLGLRVGDPVEVELREGDRSRRTLTVAATVDESMGMQGHMSHDGLSVLVREDPRVSTALLRVDPEHLADVRRRLQDYPLVASVTRRMALVERFRAQTGESMTVTMVILTLFAATIAVGVVYNNARIALSMRSRELATLRVIGFTRGEISKVLLGELGVQMLLAVPLGLWVGGQLAEGISSTIDPERYRLPLMISAESYAFAVLVALAAGTVSALLVRRRLDRLDLIGVLKTRE